MHQSTYPITGETIVEEIVDRFPLTANVFVRRGMHCVGCPIARFETLAEVCQIYRQGLDGLLVDLNAAGMTATPPMPSDSR